MRYNKTYGSLQPDGQELGGSISVSIIVKNMQVCLLHTIYISDLLTGVSYSAEDGSRGDIVR